MTHNLVLKYHTYLRYPEIARFKRLDFVLHKINVLKEYYSSIAHWSFSKQSEKRASGLCHINDMQKPPLKNSRFHFFVQVVAQRCFETNEKSIFRYLFFELLMILFIIFHGFQPTKNEKKMSQKVRIVLKQIFGFTFVVHSGLIRIQIFFYVTGPPPP